MFSRLSARRKQNRIRAGWAKFKSNKQELGSKTYSLNDRLRLFDAVVSPTILYASGTWTLTKDHERALQRTQRIMLRMILGAGRRRQTPEPDTLSQECDVDSDMDLAVNEQVKSLIMKGWSPGLTGSVESPTILNNRLNIST